MYEAQTNHPISLLSRDGALLVLMLTLLCACKCNNDVIIFQAYALGLSTVPKEDEVQRLVQAMHSRFSTVMIAEYIDESIVLARRVLCWTPEDTAYVVICTLVPPTQSPQGHCWEVGGSNQSVPPPPSLGGSRLPSTYADVSANSRV